MQNNILDKLKIKNIPKIEKTMEYNIPQIQQNININTTIVDKTSDSDVNIEDYTQLINKKKRVKKRKLYTIKDMKITGQGCTPCLYKQNEASTFYLNATIES